MVCIKEFIVNVTVLNFIKVVISFNVNEIFSKGKALKQNAFDVFDVTGPQKCVEECHLRSKCNVVSFDLEQYRCELGEDEALLQNVTDGNYIFVNNPKPGNVKLGLCHNHLCEVGTKCIPLTSGQTTCVRTECRDPPIIPNASVGRSRAVAKSTSYSCNSESVPRGYDTITCKANGEWTVTSFYCEPKRQCRTGFTFVDENLPTMRKFCYKELIRKRVKRAEAVKDCSAENSTLIKIDSRTKINVLSALKDAYYWADGTDEASEGDWRYSDGTPLEMSLFMSRQPNGGTNQNYIEFVKRRGFTDVTRQYVSFPLCEYYI